MMCAAPLLLAIVVSGVSFSSAQIMPTDEDRLLTLDLLQALSEKERRALYRWNKLPTLYQQLGYYNKIPAENDISRLESDKRSAVAAALNTGRWRRQPAPALGKVVTPYVGVGVLNDMGSFFDSLRDNLESMAFLSPEDRSNLYQDAPIVVRAPSSGRGGGSGGIGMRRVNALHPLRPTSSIRSYNRRSDMKTTGPYPKANHYDPGLLWTGLGR